MKKNNKIFLMIASLAGVIFLVSKKENAVLAGEISNGGAGEDTTEKIIPENPFSSLISGINNILNQIQNAAPIAPIQPDILPDSKNTIVSLSNKAQTVISDLGAVFAGVTAKYPGATTIEIQGGTMGIGDVNAYLDVKSINEAASIQGITPEQWVNLYGMGKS